MPMNESERFHKNTRGETPPPVELNLVCRSHEGVDSLRRFRQVMELVLEGRREGWPADAWWTERLPDWFVASFGEHSLDEIMRNAELWDFGSWLDAMKSPGWEWWSSIRDGELWTVKLRALSSPYSVGPLEYLAGAAGAELIDLRER